MVGFNVNLTCVRVTCVGNLNGELVLVALVWENPPSIGQCLLVAAQICKRHGRGLAEIRSLAASPLACLFKPS